MVTLDPHSHTEFSDFLSEEECEHIAYILRRDEHKILAIPNQDKNHFYQGTTKQYSVYNLLTHPDIRPLNIPDRIFNLPMYADFDELWVQCWGNILHQEQNLPLHTHAEEETQNPFLACSIYLDGRDPCYTHWDGEPQLNVRGTLHCAGMLHPHEVKTNIHHTPRISMAFDIYHNHDRYLNQHNRFLHIKRPIIPTIFETEYEGMSIKVKKNDNNTGLVFGDTWLIQTIIDNKDPFNTIVFPYVRQLCDVSNHVKDPQSILVLGLGGGVIPSYFKENTKCTDIDVVDINPELKSIAHEYFHMPEEGINVIIDDAFQWIHTNDAKTYDIIILDLGMDNPEYTYDNKFYKGIQNKLTPRGILAINYLAYENTPQHEGHIEQLKGIFNVVENVGNHAEKNVITYCRNK